MTRRTPVAARPDHALIEGHTDNTVAAIRSGFLANLLFTQARLPEHATPNELYLALAPAAVRDRLVQRWMSTVHALTERDVRVVCYLSAEFLLGRMLTNSLLNLGIYDEFREVVEELRLDLEELKHQESDAALGNGGLGRLAACFLDSMATLRLPGYGYGIRYEYGMFSQHIHNGYQVEHPRPSSCASC